MWKNGKGVIHDASMWTLRSGDEKDRATRSLTRSPTLAQDSSQSGKLTFPHCKPAHWSREGELVRGEYLIRLVQYVFDSEGMAVDLNDRLPQFLPNWMRTILQPILCSNLRSFGIDLSVDPTTGSKFPVPKISGL